MLENGFFYKQSRGRKRVNRKCQESIEEPEFQIASATSGDERRQVYLKMKGYNHETTPGKW